MDDGSIIPVRRNPFLTFSTVYAVPVASGKIVTVSIIAFFLSGLTILIFKENLDVNAKNHNSTVGRFYTYLYMEESRKQQENTKLKLIIITSTIINKDSQQTTTTSIAL